MEIELDPETVEKANINFDKLRDNDKNEIEKIYDLILDKYFEKVEMLLKEHGITVGKPIDLRTADINELKTPYLLTLKAIYNLINESMVGIDLNDICKKDGIKILNSWKQINKIIEEKKGNKDAESLLNIIKKEEIKRSIAVDMYSSFIRQINELYKSFNNLIDLL